MPGRGTKIPHAVQSGQQFFFKVKSIFIQLHIFWEYDGEHKQTRYILTRTPTKKTSLLDEILNFYKFQIRIRLDMSFAE